jgi:hypothetical protein
MRSIFTLVLATIALAAFSQTTITAKPGSGEWDKIATWEAGAVPSNNVTVVIPTTSTVVVKGNVYSTLTNKPNLIIRIEGTLQFEPSGVLDLGVNSSIQLVTSSSSITSQNTSNSQLIVIGGVTKYNAQIDGTLTGPKFASSGTAASGSLATGFTVGTLPVKLKSFTAQAKGNQISLKWSTAEEVNNRAFNIERSTTARNWTPIQTIAAKGEAADYSALDGTPAPGDNFYRLQSVDIDGKTEYSNVVKVSRGRSLTAYISPNPANGQVTVSLSTATTEALHLQLVSSSGQVVKEARYATGTSLVQFGLKGIAPGVYTLLLRNNNTTLEASQLLVN